MNVRHWVHKILQSLGDKNPDKYSEKQMIPNPSDTKISRGWNPSQSQGIQGIDRHSGMPFCNSMDFVKLFIIKTVSFLPLFILYIALHLNSQLVSCFPGLCASFCSLAFHVGKDLFLALLPRSRRGNSLPFQFYWFCWVKSSVLNIANVCFFFC